MRLALRPIALPAALLATFSSAAASEYCVVCETPQANYRCMTNDGRSGAGTDQRAWLQCIQQLAKSGGHESCSIDRTTVPPCLGSIRSLELDTGILDSSGTPPAETPAAKQTQSSPPPLGGEPTPLPPEAKPAEPAPADDEPTLMQKSKQNLENAGSAIGDAAKKSWDCMSSLFKKC